MLSSLVRAPGFRSADACADDGKCAEHKNGSNWIRDRWTKQNHHLLLWLLPKWAMDRLRPVLILLLANIHTQHPHTHTHVYIVRGPWPRATCSCQIERWICADNKIGDLLVSANAIVSERPTNRAASGDGRRKRSWIAHRFYVVSFDSGLFRREQLVMH